ncbi:histidine kinase [Natrialba swarupiae]|uniref:Histidine kinase n=2 Tax=Natrialba swarupiae TaxID=2448032 RepID=A0A5D5AJQ9_9EURY|nr:histidine kinase [Natrialba swarupiae]
MGPRRAVTIEMSETAATGTDGPLERVGSGLRRFVAVPLERQTYLNLAYLLLAFPLGLAYVVFVTVGVSVGLGLSILLVGIPILVATLAFTLAVAGFERWLTVTMLDLEIEPRSREANERTRDRLVSLCTNPKNWSALLYVPAKFVLGTVSFSVALTGFSTGASMLMLPLYYDRPGLYVGVVSDRAPEISQTLYLGWNYLLVGVEAVFTVGYWEISTLPEALLAAALGVVVVLGTFYVLDALTRVWGWFARLTLEGAFDPLAALTRRGT